MLANMTMINAQSKEIITIAGKVFSYNMDSHSGCFYIDHEMIEAGVAKELGNKFANSKCVSKTYGKGGSISFSRLKENADYPHAPQEDILISVTGIWLMKGQIYEFQAIEWEPFF